MGLIPGTYDRHQDLDGDGRDVFDEYVLDSHPAVSNVPFRIFMAVRSNDVVHVVADGRSERQYLVESREDLNAGHWQAFSWAQYPQGNRVTFAHTNAASRGFLRIRGFVPLP